MGGTIWICVALIILGFVGIGLFSLAYHRWAGPIKDLHPGWWISGASGVSFILAFIAIAIGATLFGT